jgi:nucleotide-binding universal stress UspA family protein
MSNVVVICTDGSDIATEAASAGLALLRDDATVILVTVIEENDPTLVTGAGMAGGVMSAEAYDTLSRQRTSEGERAVEQLAARLGIKNARTELLHGDAGMAICEFASEVSASVIVLGSRGRGGFKRALLGSVSDYVVRNAPCSVLVTGPAATD